MTAVAIYEEPGQDPAVRHSCPHFRDSLTTYHSRLLKNYIVIGADPDNDNAKRGLAEAYEVLGETTKALGAVDQGA